MNGYAVIPIEEYCKLKKLENKNFEYDLRTSEESWRVQVKKSANENNEIEDVDTWLNSLYESEECLS